LVRRALLLLSVAILAHGAEGIYYAARNRQIASVTCPEFMLRPPNAEWLRVVGCDIDYMHPAFAASRDRVTELFFAMRPRNDPRDAPVSLVVASRDPQVLAIAQQTLGPRTDLDEETFTVAMLRVVSVLRAAREVDGYARKGVLERALVRHALTGFDAPLTSRVMVLDLHARPSFVRPVVETGTGLLGALAAIGFRRRRFHEQPAAVGKPPAASLERRLPPAMLVNLDVSAAVSEIEYAPPLGDHAEVAARISTILGPLTDEGGGRYHVGGADWRMGLDLGRDTVVWTVALDVRGSDAAIDALDRLVRATNWRVFVPRLGTFR
jgi:hypothetical protein